MPPYEVSSRFSNMYPKTTSTPLRCTRIGTRVRLPRIIRFESATRSAMDPWAADVKQPHIYNLNCSLISDQPAVSRLLDICAWPILPHQQTVYAFLVLNFSNRVFLKDNTSKVPILNNLFTVLFRINNYVTIRSETPSPSI